VEPWVSRLELEGDCKLFLDEGELWPEGKFVTTHLVVTKAFLAHQPDAVKNLLRSLVEVTQQINSDKKTVAQTLNAQIKAETGKALKSEVIDRAMSRVDFTWDPMVESLVRSAEEAHKIGFIRSPPQLEGIYSVGLLNTILKEKDLPTIADPNKPTATP